MCTVYSALSVSSNLVVEEINEPDSTILFLSDNYNRKGISAHGKEVPVVLLNNGFCFYGSISYKHQPKKDDLLEGTVFMHKWDYSRKSLILFSKKACQTLIAMM